MPKETTQRNTSVQEITTLAAKLKQDQARIKSGSKMSREQRRPIVRRIVANTKRIDDLRAQSAVNDGINEANKRK